MSCEARITELQNEANALRNQVDELKGMLETELGRIQADIQSQLSEAKQLLLSRETESMARVARLESELAKVTRVCELALRREDLLSSLADESSVICSAADANRKPLVNSERQRPPNSSESDVCSREEALSIQQSGAVDPAAAHDAASVESTLSDLQGRLEEVYAFYTATSAVNAELLQPAMHLTHFTVMVRDAGLSTARRPVLPELLWMAVVRGLSPVLSRERAAPRRGSTLLHPRVYRDGVNQQQQKDSFARERLQSISRQQFGEALYIAYCAALQHTHKSPPTLKHFRTFMLDTFLPSVERHMSSRASKKSPHRISGEAFRSVNSGPPSAEASVSFSTLSNEPRSSLTGLFEDAATSYAADDAVRHVVQQFAPQLKQSFLKAVHGPPQQRAQEARMSLEAFAECIRAHHLLPLLSRIEVKAVFLFCIQRQIPCQSEVGYDTIAYGSFVTAMYCVAELVYGRDPTLRQQYPSPHSRISKLFVKMFVL